jgi:NAD(P)-dependent dehydrogenase (short-subunit alcohol dehydrogenase family)
MSAASETERPGMSASAGPLRGVRALITGGGSGIGLAIAHRFAAMGMTLTLVGRDDERLHRAIGELPKPARHRTFVCDVGDDAAVAAMFRDLADSQLSPQVLVNNAGSASSASVADTSTDAWNETLRVNLSGVFHCARAALPAFGAMPFARIVNIASTAGLIGYANVAAYCAAKHGVIGLTRALALEVARTGITVNAVCPGYTETSIVNDAIESIVERTGRSQADARQVLLRRNPQRRLVSPDEVAATVAWLCLPESRSINGQAISLSGGEVMTG